MAPSKKIIIAIVAVVLIVALIIYFYTRPSPTKDHTTAHTTAHAAAVVAVATGQTPAPVVVTPSTTTTTVVQPTDDGSGSVAVTSTTVPKTSAALPATSTTIVTPAATQTNVQSNLAAHIPVVEAAVKSPTPTPSESVTPSTISTIQPKSGGGVTVTSDTAGTVSTTTTIHQNQYTDAPPEPSGRAVAVYNLRETYYKGTALPDAPSYANAYTPGKANQGYYIENTGTVPITSVTATISAGYANMGIWTYTLQKEGQVVPGSEWNTLYPPIAGQSYTMPCNVPPGGAFVINTSQTNAGSVDITLIDGSR